MAKKKPPSPRKSGSAAMAHAGLKQANYWLTEEEAEILKEAADARGQSVMSLVQHVIRTQIIEEHRKKNG
jgi:uncharacterized protein (DUF1778 family)